jgi:hypothetical protein
MLIGRTAGTSMSESERIRLEQELKGHERELLLLSGQLQCSPAEHSVYLNAQVLKHRISVALLYSQLGTIS